MSGSRIEALVAAAQASFDRQPDVIEDGLDVDEADVLQLRKSCRLLAGAEALLEAEFYTLVVESSFVAVERVILPEHVAGELRDLWRNHRAKTYYQDGLASRKRAELLFELASETHEFVVNLSSKKHECICD